MISGVNLEKQTGCSQIDLVYNMISEYGCKSLSRKNVVITNATRVSDLEDYIADDKLFLLIVVGVFNYDQMRDFFDTALSFRVKTILFCNPGINCGEYPKLQKSLNLDFEIYFSQELNTTDPCIFITFIHELLLQDSNRCIIC